MMSIVSKLISVLTKPWESMAEVKNDTSLKSSMIFVVVMGVLSGVISTIWGFIIPPPQVAAGAVSKASLLLAIPLVPLVSFALSFVGSFILWGIIHGLLKGSLGEYKTIYKIFALLAAFSPLNSILAPIPVVGQWIAILINIWGIIVLIQGIIIVVGTPVTRTWVVLGIIFVLLFLLGLVFRSEAQRQFQSAGPGFDATGAGAYGDDLGDENALNKELEEMANKAKAAQQATPAPAK